MPNHLDKSLINVKAFLGDDAVKLISLCGLTPLDNWRTWTDNAGNDLHIGEDKKLKIKKSKVIDFKTCDLYYRAPPAKIAETSKWALLAKGVLNNNDCMFIWFIGKDDRIRLLSFVDDECKNKNPLSSGVNTLMYIIENMSKEEVSLVPCDVVEPPVKSNIIEAFSTAWPPVNDSSNKVFNVVQEIISQSKSE